ncbi:MAG: hypothetical protein DRP82_00245 [Planctomycetota bacterium]|nr:MAG: hypothetical protein DRP82_00245 [Planctomycetota bacterium]
MREKTRFIQMADTLNLEGEMKSLHEVLCKLYDMVVNDHKDEIVCTGYTNFMNTSPKARLDEVAKKLRRQVYNVGFAGIFSVGKSTLINALLDEPEFLPEALEPCTMSITLIGNPDPGTPERVEVKYYTKEQALRNIFDNFRYRDVAEKVKQQVLQSFSVEAAENAIKEMIRDLKENQGEYQNALQRAEELEEFLQYLHDPDISRRLGTVWVDNIENAPTYLTRDKNLKGMGHLLLIEQVTVFKDNPLFTRHGVRIIDLPGTDDVNERQRQLTYQYLSEADAVVLMIQPRGFEAEAVRIRDELNKYNKEVRDKMFTVINMFDQVTLEQLEPEAFKRFSREIINTMVGHLGLDIEKFYVTSALYYKLLQKERQGTLTPEEKEQLENMRADMNRKLEAVTRRPLEPMFQTRVRNCFTDGGVPALRQALMNYLEKDIRIARLKEVYFFLKDVYDAFKLMLEPEFKRIEDFISSARDRKMMIHEFMEKLRDIFYDAISPVSEELKNVMTRTITKIGEKFVPGVARFIDGMAVARIKMQLSDELGGQPSAFDIKVRMIKTCQRQLPKIFVDVMEEHTAKLLVQRVREVLEKTPIAEVFKHLSRGMDKNYLEIWENALKRFEDDVRRLTRMRAMEEMWKLQAKQIKPAPGGGEFDRAEQKKFKEQLKQVFVNAFGQHSENLKDVIWRYHDASLRDFVKSFENIVEQLEEDVTLEQDKVSLPMNLVTGEAEKQEREYKIFGYWQLFETAKKHYEKIEKHFEEFIQEK